MKRIAEIPIPENLSEVQKAEYIAFRDAMTDIENEWEALENGTNPDQKSCIDLVKDTKKKRHAQAEERLKIRLEVIEEQMKRESERIKTDLDDYRKLLFERLMRAYYQSYQTITGHLKELLGKEYQQFITAHPIDFPTVPSEGQMKTRTQQPDEGKPRLSSVDVEKDVHQIQEILAGKLSDY